YDMKILLVGASGMIGSRVAAEALARGHEVTGVSRSGPGPQAAASDAARIAELATGQDAAVLAGSPPRDGAAPAAPPLAAGRGFLEGVRRAGVQRAIVVGGAGSLETAPGVRLVDSPAFPAVHRNEALAQADLLAAVRAEAGDLDWTYISPAALIEP